MKASERISPDCIATLREEIRGALGNEIFAVGQVDTAGIICAIKVAARGTADSVPVLDNHIDKGDVVLHNHPSGGLSPSSADMSIAYRLGNAGVGFYIVDNDVTEVYAAAEPILLREIIRIEVDDLAAVLLPGGRFSQLSAQYETRQSQVAMLKQVSRSFNENRICVAEAGTGVGKSLAYLLPACRWIANNNQRVVVSTGTINLQQQLIEKDIPLVNKLLETEIKAVLVKGRGNYLCKNRLQEALADNVSLFREQQAELENIYQWSLTTADGSRSELPFLPSPELWGQVCSEADICLGLRCTRRETCFMLKARKEAAAARLLVVNHHLLFADLEVRVSGMGWDTAAVLPPFQHIIFDEAHNVESSATSFFSQTFSRYTITRCLRRLYSEKGTRRFGLALKLEPLLKKKDRQRLADLPRLIEDITATTDFLENNCLSLMGENCHYYLADLKTLAADVCNGLLFDPLAGLAGGILTLCNLFDEIFDLIDDEAHLAVYETSLQLKRLKNIAAIANRFRDFDSSPEDVFWLEKSRGYQGQFYARFYITPLDISETMQEAVFKPYESVTFTSATLSVAGSFDFWKSRLGLPQDVLEESFPSPFNYAENVLLAIPADAPQPAQSGYQAYLSDFIFSIIRLSGGRALVLFTSYAMLNQTCRDLGAKLAALRIPLFKQGDDDRARLLSGFRDDINSVLFATDSFWEGVDTPGKALEVLIICKLPFKVPTDPVIRARMADIERKGGNPFMDYSLPEAVIKLKQGFGRLMRRGDDKGVVVILDSRISGKNYGKAFLDSLPPAERIICPGKAVLTRVEEFIACLRQDEGK